MSGRFHSTSNDAWRNTDTAECGRFGEDAAAKFLKEKGFKILKRNLHVSRYEVDILAENKEYLVFTEVKARTVPYLDRNGNPPFSITPAMAVNKEKQRRLSAAAKLYLLRHPTEKQPRLDVIEVFLKKISETPETTFEILRIHHIENAFSAR